MSSDITVGEIYIIGGTLLFEEAIGKYKEQCKYIYLTRINKAYKCDTFMPEIPNCFKNMSISQTYS
jgi:dihydrofolate reductase